MVINTPWAHANTPAHPRTFRLRTYKRCFVGTDAVRWLVRTGAAADEAAALELGNRMLQLGLLHHVLYEHEFRNQHLYYRFSQDDDWGCDALGAAAAPERAASTSGAGGARGGGVSGSRGSGGGGGAKAAPPVGGQQQYRAIMQAQVNQLHQKASMLLCQQQIQCALFPQLFARRSRRGCRRADSHKTAPAYAPAPGAAPPCHCCRCMHSVMTFACNVSYSACS